MPDDKTKYNWMAKAWNEPLWDAPPDDAPDGAAHAPLDASLQAGAGLSIPPQSGPGKAPIVQRSPEVHATLTSPASTTSSHASRAGRGVNSQCLCLSCEPAMGFARQWELDRNVLVAHVGRKDFVCPYTGCYQGTQVSSFARSDKLTAHIKTRHRHDTDRLIACPAASCAHPQSKLSELARHIRNDHLVQSTALKQRLRCGDEVEIFRSIANAAPKADNQI